MAIVPELVNYILCDVLAQPKHHCSTPIQSAEEECSLDIREVPKSIIQGGERICCNHLVYLEELLILAYDALPYGLGTVLSHRMQNGSERPIAFA